MNRLSFSRIVLTFGVFSQAIFAQTSITNYTSAISCTIATNWDSRGRPELDVSTAGTNYLVLSYRQWKNGTSVVTNKSISGTNINTNEIAIPNGASYIFRINNPSNLTCVYTNTNGHSHYAGGIVSASNKVWLYYAQPAVLTNVFTSYVYVPPAPVTNIYTDLWGSPVSGTLTTTNNGTNWTFNTVPGSGTPGFLVEGGNGAQTTNYGMIVIASTNSSGKVVFNFYRFP